jgi:hypothetical protein
VLSPRDFFTASAALVLAAMTARSYSAKASTIRRMSTAAGSSPSVPSPAALTTRAPASSVSRSIMAAAITSRASRSLFATASTPAP